MIDWVEEAEQALSFVEDPDHRTHILMRFEGQYLPALRNAKNQEEVWRAWEALRFYLLARATKRKQFVLTGDQADACIAATTSLLDLRPHTAPESL